MIETEITILTIIRIINIILASTCIIMWLIFYKEKREIGAIAPITWLFNFLAFSAWRFFRPENSVETLITASWWTALLCAHAIILLFVSALMSGFPTKKKKKGDKI